MENWNKFLLEGDYDIEELLDVYVDNPMDFNMPDEIALHPKMLKGRREIWKVAINRCEKIKGERPPFPGSMESMGQNREHHDVITDIENKKKELNRIVMRLNDMMTETNFDTIKDNPEFKRLVARQRELQDEVNNSSSAEFEAGQQIGANIRANLNAWMAVATDTSCLDVNMASDHGGGPHKTLSRLESSWRKRYDLEQRIQKIDDDLEQRIQKTKSKKRNK